MGNPSDVVFNAGNIMFAVKSDPSNKAYLCVKEDQYTPPPKPKYIFNPKGETTCPTDYTFILDEDTCNKASEDRFGKTGVEVVQWKTALIGCHVYNMGNPSDVVFNAGHLDGEVNWKNPNKAYLCVRK